MSQHDDLVKKTFARIEKARERLAQPNSKNERAIVLTPVKHSPALSGLTGADVWLKLEILQRTGSYKERGARNKLLRLLAKNKGLKSVVAASAGNHAQGVAYHATDLGLEARIFMPKNTPRVKVERTESFGGKVVLFGENFDEAQAHMLRTKGDDEALIKPFDDKHVIAGQGTVALEFLDSVKDVDILVVPIGGGGLIAGMAVAAKTIRPKIRIFGAEPAVCPSWANRRQGVNATKASELSVAEGIFVERVGDKTFKVADPLIEDVIGVDEEIIEQAMSRLAQHERLVVEGAGAAGLGAVLSAPEKFRGQKVGLVLSGGNVDMRLFGSVLTRAMVRDGRLVVLQIVCKDEPGILAKIADIIGKNNGNIVSIGHHRSVTTRPAKIAELEVEIEVSGAAMKNAILNALSGAGFMAEAKAGHLDA